MTRKCRHCRQPLVQRPGEHITTFLNRHYCGTTCIVSEAQACQPLPVILDTSYAGKLAEAQALARATLKGRRK